MCVAGPSCRRKRKQLPGSPATLYGRWDPVAPEGCHKLLESLGKEKDDFKALAESARARRHW